MSSLSASAACAAVLAAPVTVLLFAHPRELFGAPSLTLSLPAGATVAAVRGALAALPQLAAALPSCALAVGDRLVARDAEDATPCGAEVALIPPVSGG